VATELVPLPLLARRRVDLLLSELSWRPNVLTTIPQPEFDQALAFAELNMPICENQ
jgi:hypothetical protein